MDCDMRNDGPVVEYEVPNQSECSTTAGAENEQDLCEILGTSQSIDLTFRLSDMPESVQPAVFIVDKIIRYRQVRRRKYVLIKWKGWRKASWEQVENVMNLPKPSPKNPPKEIISLVGRRRMKGNIEYRAHFRGYDAKHDLWTKESLINKKRPDLVEDYKEKHGADVEAFSHLKRASYRKGRKRNSDEMLLPHLQSAVITEQCTERPVKWIDIGIGFRIPAFARPYENRERGRRAEQADGFLISSTAHMVLDCQIDDSEIMEEEVERLPEITWLSFPPLPRIPRLPLFKRPLSPPPASLTVLLPVQPTYSVTEQVTTTGSCIVESTSAFSSEKDRPVLSLSEAEEYSAILSNHVAEPDSTTDIPEHELQSASAVPVLCDDMQHDGEITSTNVTKLRDSLPTSTCCEPPSDAPPAVKSVKEVSPTCTRVSVIVRAPSRKDEHRNESLTSDKNAKASASADLTAAFSQKCSQQVKVMEKKPVNTWSVDDLESYLYIRGYERVALTVRKLNIDGQRLLSMVDRATNVRQQLGLLYADGSKFLCLIRELQSLKDESFTSDNSR